jgi:hypothetical protein
MLWLPDVAHLLQDLKRRVVVRASMHGTETISSGLYRFGVRSAQYHGFDVLAEIWFTAGLAQFGKERVNLAERREHFTVSRQERNGVDCTFEWCWHVDSVLATAQ